MWPFRKPKKAVSLPRVHFISEKTGDAEDVLKAHLREMLIKDKKTQRAYLAAVQYEGHDDFAVALCLVRPGPNSLDLVGKTASAFAELFSSREHLDMILLSNSQVEEIEEVCKPFYQK